MRLKLSIVCLFACLMSSCGERDSATESVAQNPQLSTSSENSGIQSESVGQAAKLTPEQIERLISVQSETLKAIVPTYIPSGFEVELIDIEIIPRSNRGLGGRSYKIIYRDANGLCFKVTGYTYTSGGDPNVYKTIDVVSPLFGKTTLKYLNFERNTDRIISMGPQFPLNVKGMQFNFYSTFYTPAMAPNCSDRVISLQEAKKIVESLQYLSP
jgi:hypothetical protein